MPGYRTSFGRKRRFRRRGTKRRKFSKKKGGSTVARVKLPKMNGYLKLKLKSSTLVLSSPYQAMFTELLGGDYSSDRDITTGESLLMYSTSASVPDDIRHAARNFFFYQFDASHFLSYNFDGFQIFSMMKITKCWMTMTRLSLGGFTGVISGGGVLGPEGGTIAQTVAPIWQQPTLIVHYRYMPLTGHPWMLGVGYANVRDEVNEFCSNVSTRHVTLRPGRRILFPMPLRVWYAGTRSSTTTHALTTTHLATTHPIRSTKLGWVETAGVFGNEGLTELSGYAGGPKVFRYRSNYLVVFFEHACLAGNTGESVQNLVIRRKQGCTVQFRGLRVESGGSEPMVPMATGDGGPYNMSTMPNYFPYQDWVGLHVTQGSKPTTEVTPAVSSASTFIYGPSYATQSIAGVPEAEEPGDAT